MEIHLLVDLVRELLVLRCGEAGEWYFQYGVYCRCGVRRSRVTEIYENMKAGNKG